MLRSRVESHHPDDKSKLPIVPKNISPTEGSSLPTNFITNGELET